MALKVGGELLFPEYAKKSPFLVDQFEDFFIGTSLHDPLLVYIDGIEGGLDDMAVWTTYCWPYVMEWFLNGPGADPAICLAMQSSMPNLNFTEITQRSPGLIEKMDANWRNTHFPEALQKVRETLLLDTVIYDSARKRMP